MVINGSRGLKVLNIRRHGDQEFARSESFEYLEVWRSGVL